MQYSISNISEEYDFCIEGTSYAGAPRNNTMMYISKKVEYLVDNLIGKKNCLVFLENGIKIPYELRKDNCFVFSDNPQFAYAKFATEFANKQRIQEKDLGYTLTSGGYYVGNNVEIGENAYIEPNVLIGHNVKIGNDAIIQAGAIIKHAVIGNNFLCNEHAVIGSFSFTLAEDENRNKYRIPALGRVIIGDCVEIGVSNDIAVGACGDTIIEDYVKLDALVYIGHEAHLHKNTQINAGVTVGGFVELFEHSYLGMNSSIKNRIHLGENCIVGMGANVIKEVDDDVTVIGNPARSMITK